MSIFRQPDFEQMRQRGDFPRLIHWALYDKDPGASRAAVASLRKDVPALIEYLYETAAWAQKHTVGRRRMLPSRSVKLLDEAVRGVARVGGRAAAPLGAAIRGYDEYADDDEDAKVLFFLLAFEALEKIGSPAVAELQQLARSTDAQVATPAREALARLDARGLVRRAADDPRRHRDG